MLLLTAFSDAAVGGGPPTSSNAAAALVVQQLSALLLKVTGESNSVFVVGPIAPGFIFHHAEKVGDSRCWCYWYISKDT